MRFRHVVGAVTVACAVAGASLAGCAVSARPSATQAAPSSSSSGGAAGMESSPGATSDAAGMPSSAGASAGYSSGGVAPSSRPPTMAVPPGDVAGGGGRRSIDEWQAELDQGMRQLQTGGECREVCRASGGICTAAREICALTGDGDVSPPSDGRCGRARAACEQATRQRNGACPVCPAER